MNCAYHSYNAANVNCNGCGKPLCPACDHRIKGFPYCQDCIVEGIELLRNRNQSSYSQYVKSQTSPFIAFILSFCPGLGAAYNGQTFKALVHFGVSVGMIQLMLQHKMAVFFFGFLGMWLYSALDAWKTARMIKRGVTPESAENILVQRFSGNLKLWAVLLIALGILFFIDARFLMRGMLPVLLIGLGVYILRYYVFKPNEDAMKSTNFEQRTESPNFITAMNSSDYSSNSYNSQDDFATQTKVKGWKNR
jgi:hypothetical protein